MNTIQKLRYYFWASFRRKLIDQLLEKHRSIYRGVVLDIGGRDRGRFNKPKNEVTKWIFADICPEHKPDIVLNASDMHMLQDGTIDVIAAMEVFAHVERLEQALDECYRVLKSGGTFVFSVLMTYPIIQDPTDFQRWTDAKWKMELEKRGFTIQKIEIMGRYFTVLADFINIATKSIPPLLKYLTYPFYPLLSVMVRLDKTRFVLKNKRLSSFTTGYFIIATKP
jgi:SAM-dependent methyltransferase